MKAFGDFLSERLESGGFSTEDALAAVLPLTRQVIDAHSAHLVAPLEGLNALRVEGTVIWFEEATRKPLEINSRAISRLDAPPRGGIEVVSELKVTMDVGGDGLQHIDLHVGQPGEEITRPVYLPGYVSWEHAVGHHDPIVDVFSLGLILASLACGLDLRDPEDLKSFVASRGNLFRINPGLHPVLAKAIVNMTELSRHKRPQDLQAVMRSLENYREQETGIDFDLASIRGFGERDRTGRQALILERLQDRLFEISRRNRLLHFRDTAGSVCLTEASVPLAFDVRSIRPNQILTWGGRFQKDIESGEAVPLNRYMNFREALYLGPTLDRIRAESLRDQAEFGFQQLRLVLCFLRWADVKSDPPEQYLSPLVLLTVRLIKKKGVRDTYLIEPHSTVAEINPVLRHLLRQLYGIELPETIDLAEGSLEDLHSSLKKLVESSDASIALKKIDRPRIDLIHERARRRLDMYRRRARLSGRGLNRFLDLDYSYDPHNFHPLGLRMFNTWIRPAETHLQSVLKGRPDPRHFLTSEESEAPDSVKERDFYVLREGAEGNPYVWEFDLCRVTLGNFRYRKMTLVRDYVELQENARSNAAFEAVFSLSPRPVEDDKQGAPPLEDRYDVVACDPTQAITIRLARAGRSYIIQGPPGTGKSQTITNLIADYVARGKRVLFVCEKRAAIDVVYARLKQRGLQALCCLIHDSQTDKRDFVMDLKLTYESLVEAADEGHHRFRHQRERMDKVLREEAAQVQAHGEAMLSVPKEAGVTLQALLRRGTELADVHSELSALEMERVPFYASWACSRPQIAALIDKLAQIQEDRVLAHHPLRLLRTDLKDVDRPMEHVTAALDEAEPILERAIELLRDLAIPESLRGTFRGLDGLTQLAAEAEILTHQRLLRVLDPQSDLGRRFGTHRRACVKAGQALEAAAGDTVNWREKLPSGDATLALQEARRFEGSALAFLTPSWWRMRRILRQRYDFAAHIVRPKWSHVLGSLVKEYEAAEALRRAEEDMCAACGISEPLQEVLMCVECLEGRAATAESGERLHWLLGLPDPHEAATRLTGMRAEVQRLAELLGRVLEDYEGCSPEDLLDNLLTIRESMDDLTCFLACLSEMAEMPPDLSRAFRHLPVSPLELEAAAVRRTLDAVYRSHPHLRLFNAHRREAVCRRLHTAYQKWQDLNTHVVLEQVRLRFLDHLRVASRPAAQLTPEESEFKRRFNNGRKELEHEFGKVMRYRSIRDLVGGDSGRVIDDLKPVWLMSPLSVSDTLPLDDSRFHVVIFDEASQITLEEAAPALFRAGQAIVVGDTMQLPPTNFFSAKRREEQESVVQEDVEESVDYDLSVNSFLSCAARNLSGRMLGWHYRSRSESLISFSNWAFYEGRLLTVPENELNCSRRPEILVKDPAEGDANSREMLGRAVSFHRMLSANYQNRRNRFEAEYIARMVRALLRDPANPSIGIVAFSEAQQDEIENALDRLAAEDPEFRETLEAELTREQDGQFAGLLVKNLENMQGDEREVIILSVCYGHGPDGKMRMNFGPINQSGGEKRLNVAFSRAKHHMALVSSIQHSDITNDYNNGANCLKNYLHYAAACSAGDIPTAQRILRNMCLWRDPEEQARAAKPSMLVRQIGEAMAAQGYLVDYGVGMSDFRCAIGVRREGEEAYRLGILVDEDAYYQRGDLIEREILRPRLLSTFGWKVARVLVKDWCEDREGVLRRLTAMASGEMPAEEITIDPAFADILEARLSEAEELLPHVPAGGTFPGKPPVVSHAGDLAIPAISGDRPRYFEFIGGTSRKFWEITLSGPRSSVRFGRIGTLGQERVKSFQNEDAARRSAERMIGEKLRKGYEEKPRPNPGTTPHRGGSPAEGEHQDDEEGAESLDS
ncbi:MAG: WGR domain-containing protein [Phycisphaerae bacterium]|nr:WGR domain-containing protein [Phycisphaerae bacterium]